MLTYTLVLSQLPIQISNHLEIIFFCLFNRISILNHTGISGFYDGGPASNGYQTNGTQARGMIDTHHHFLPDFFIQGSYFSFQPLLWYLLTQLNSNRCRWWRWLRMAFAAVDTCSHR